jgi:GH25 family lysozyme M1 (1,4-beta-N-acetylmuramidase)
MAQLYGVDVSYAQKTIDWDALNAASNFAMIRSCYGTGGVDTEFARNKNEAHRVQAAAGPLGIGYYHYAYPQYSVNTPQAEAAYFVGNVGALQPGDVLALDWEEPYDGDHVQWCLEFLNAVTSATGVRPLIYLNQSLVASHDWSPVINGNYGLWLAAYDGDKTGSGPSTQWPFTAMRQWTNSDAVAGISPVDGDVFYGDFNAWNAYGKH